jgi:hypothetical protein
VRLFAWQSQDRRHEVSCSHIDACAAGDKGREVLFCAAPVAAVKENTKRKIKRERIFNSDV